MNIYLKNNNKYINSLKIGIELKNFKKNFFAEVEDKKKNKSTHHNYHDIQAQDDDEPICTFVVYVFKNIAKKWVMK